MAAPDTGGRATTIGIGMRSQRTRWSCDAPAALPRRAQRAGTLAAGLGCGAGRAYGGGAVLLGRRPRVCVGRRAGGGRGLCWRGGARGGAAMSLKADEWAMELPPPPEAIR